MYNGEWVQGTLGTEPYNAKGKIMKKMIILGSLVTVASAIALAQETPKDDGVVKETVRYDDLNLSTSAGAEALYKRIRAASGRVCNLPGISTERNLKLSSYTRKCVDASIQKAVVQINVATLTYYYKKHGGVIPSEIATSVLAEKF